MKKCSHWGGSSGQGEEWADHSGKDMSKFMCFQSVGAQKFPAVPFWETLRCLLSFHGILERWEGVTNGQVYFQISKWNCELNVSLVLLTMAVVAFSLWLFLFHLPSLLATTVLHGITLAPHSPCQSAIPGKALQMCIQHRVLTSV